jgi:prepilin signal peptidase PulO-like enzyme (type II secretory pathway)
MACGTALIWSIRLVGRATLKKEAMGFGDVTLMAMIGSFIGWQATLVVFFLAPLAGLVVGLIQFVMHREDEVPYGPFLCLATLVTLLSWPSLWNYLAPIFASLGSALPVLLLFCLGLMALLLAVWARIKKNFYQPANKV